MALLFLFAALQRPGDYIQSLSYIGDQRALYAKNYSLLSRTRNDGFFLRANLADHYYLSEHDNFLAHRDSRKALVIRGAVGIYAYYAGPEVVIIDNYALTDALLARLPAKPRKNKRYLGLTIGHFPRGKPEGYVDARLKNESSFIDSTLRPYYDQLRLITSGRLLDPNRLRAIIGFNLGQYEPIIKNYIDEKYWQTTEVPNGDKVLVGKG